MKIRIFFSTVLTFLVIALFICAVRAKKSHRSIGKAVSKLCIALTPPVLGNLIIIGSSVKERSVFGYYIYFIGIDIVLLALVNFSDE